MIETPYDARIAAQKKRIRQHSGDDSALRKDLNKLRARRWDANQAAKPPTPLPWSGQYETTVGQLNRDYDYDTANLAADEQSLRKGYGFDNPSDPFSRANQIQQGFAVANRGTLNNYAAGGQLYAGALTNARAIDRQNFESEWDTAQKDYQAQLNDLAQRRLEAARTRDEGVLAAEAQRLEDAVAEPTDPAEAPERPNFGQQGKSGGNQQHKPPKKKGK